MVEQGCGRPLGERVAAPRGCAKGLSAHSSTAAASRSAGGRQDGCPRERAPAAGRRRTPAAVSDDWNRQLHRPMRAS
jgi:hypothetical protein